MGQFRLAILGRSSTKGPSQTSQGPFSLVDQAFLLKVTRTLHKLSKVAWFSLSTRAVFGGTPKSLVDLLRRSLTDLEHSFRKGPSQNRKAKLTYGEGPCEVGLVVRPLQVSAPFSNTNTAAMYHGHGARTPTVALIQQGHWIQSY